MQSTAYNKHYCFNAENGLSYHATCDGLVYFIGSTCSTPYQPKIPTMAPTPVSQKVAAQSCIEGYFVTPWSYNYTIGYLGISCAIVPDISAYSCFSAYEMLQLESGESKFMKDIKIGDSILVAMSDNNRKLSSLSKEIIQNDNRYTNTISYQNDIISTTTNHDHYHHHHRRRFAYSPVVAIPHSINNKIKSKFLLVTLSSGISIQITPYHLLLTRNCNNKNNDNNHNILSLHPASSLIADLSCVETTNGIEMVIEVTTVYLEGVYTVVTLDGEYIVVNGIIVSPFANSHYLGHKFYEIYRFVYKYFPSWLLVSKLFVNTIDEVVDILSSIMS